MQTIYLVSQTHWDREWYLTFEQYRHHLVEVLEQVLDTLEQVPHFHSFTFDGQTSPITDYLDIHPEVRERVRKQVSAGKLIVGPCYVIPDEFAPSGEALIRNFLIGGADARELGGKPDMVYMAEPTDFPEQFPQILRGLGYDAAVVGRGHYTDQPYDGPHPSTVSEFVWEGGDGSRVLIHHTPAWYVDHKGERCSLHYCAAAEVFWGPEYDPLREQPRTVFPGHIEDALLRTGILREHLTRIATGDAILFHHGCDHLPAQEDTPQIVREVNERLEDAKIVHASYTDYMNAVRGWQEKLPVYKGESRGRGSSHSHVFVQRWNRDLLIALERWAEPTLALAALHGARHTTSGLRKHAWRLALQNLCHDTIWGASVDAVYDEMKIRFLKAMQVAEDLTLRSIQDLAASVDTASVPHDPDDTALVVCSTSGWRQNGLIETELHLPPDSVGDNLRVTGPDGDTWPAQVLSSARTKRRTDRFGLMAIAEPVRAVRAVIRTPELPAVGCVVASAATCDEAMSTDLRCGETWLENDLVRVDVHADGSFDVTDKQRGKRYPGLNRLVDQGDHGHGWRFISVEHDRLLSPPEGTCELVEAGPVRGKIRVQIPWKLPVGLSDDGKGRSRKRRVCSLAVEISLWTGSARVDVKTTLDNRVEFHRLRAHAPTDVRTQTAPADAAFGVHERRIRFTDPNAAAPKRAKGSILTRPEETGMMHSFVDVSDGDCGLALLTRGVPQYEVIEGESGGIGLALTLMRASIGHIIEHDPDLTRGAQCQGEQTAEYAFYPHGGTWAEGGVHQEALAYTSPSRVVHTSWHGGASPAETEWLGELPAGIALTAIRQPEDGTGTVLRLVNLLQEASRAELRLAIPGGVEEVWKSDLREQPVERLPMDADGRLSLDFGPKEIVTIRITGRD